MSSSSSSSPSNSPPTLSRQNSGTTGVIAFEAMSPQKQRQMAFSSQAHGIIPQKHLSAATISPKTVPRGIVEDRTTYSTPTKAATDRYLTNLFSRTRGYQ